MTETKNYNTFFLTLFIILNTSIIFAAGNPESTIIDSINIIKDSDLQPSIDRVSKALRKNLPIESIENDFIKKHNFISAGFTVTPQQENQFTYNIGFTIRDIGKDQIPKVNFSPNNDWSLSNPKSHESISTGSDFYSLGFKTKNIRYYKYEGLNPLFPKNHPYNNSFYTTLSGKKQNVLERFIFFRWTGKTLCVGLDNYMFAVDCNTGLVFAYIKIGDWNEAFGAQIPTRYDPLDMYTIEEGTMRWFFEYDPIGFIAENGDLIFYDWYIENTQQKLEVQLITTLPLGNSPYFVE